MLYVIRHGRTDWNDQFKLQGQTDTNLNEEGIKGAQKARDDYKDVHFDICYCSPLNRAKQTADIILEGRNIPIIYDERLKEIKFGDYEGATGYYDDPNEPGYNFFHNPPEYRKPYENAESFEELFERTGSFIDEVALPLVIEGKDVLIVGHGCVNSSIICKVKNIPLKDFWSEGIENCILKRII